MRSVPSDSVYAKTAKGIREVEESHVKLPRDLEVVFALVDGKSSAAELLPRSELTALRLYQALDLLVADGYIELAPESTSAPERKQQVHVTPPPPESDTAERVRQLNERVQVERRSRERSEREARRALTDFGAPAYEGREIQPTDSPASAEMREVGAESNARHQHMPTSLERAMSRLAESGKAVETIAPSSTAPPVPASDPSSRRPAEPVVETHSAQPGPKTVDAGARERRRAASVPSSHDAAASAETTRSQHEEMRDRRARPAQLKTIAFGLVLVGIPAAVIAWLQFTPLNNYVPAVQQALADRLQQPASVGTVRYLVLPRPRLVLENVRVGKGQELRAERIETHLLPWVALGKPRHVELVDAYGVQFDARAVGMMAQWATAAPAAALRTDRLRLFAAKLNLPNTDLGAFDGNIAFGPDGAVTDALFTSAHARLELTPVDRGLRFVLNAHEWRMPYGPPFEFSELVADGRVDRTQSATAQFNGKAAGGAVAGTLSARWAGAISMNGQFKIEQARIHDLAGGFMKSVGARGILNTTGRFTMQAPEWEQLPRNPQVDAQFSIARGELTNVDLLRALQSQSAASIRGGRTPFEKLSGVMRAADGHYSYRELQLVSGPLNATGLIDVAANGELSGRISTELGSKGGVVARSALILTGTVQDPQAKR